MKTLFSVIVALATSAPLAIAEPQTALVSWTLHSDRFIENDAESVSAVVKQNPEIFGAVATTKTVPRNAELPVFEKHLDLALKEVSNSAEPRLVISLNSHGKRGYVCRDCGEFELEKVVDSIERQVRRYSKNGKAIPVTILYSACFSGTLVPVLKERATSAKGLASPMVAITSAPEYSVSHGGEYPRALGIAAHHYNLLVRSGDALKGMSPTEKLGEIMASFITSSRDEPATWSSANPDPQWTREDVKTLLTAVRGEFTFSDRFAKALRKNSASATPGTFSHFAGEVGSFIGEKALVDNLVSGLDKGSLTREVTELLAHPGLTIETRSLLAAWASTLPETQIESGPVAAAISSETGLTEGKAEWLRRRLAARDELPKRPGPFPSLTTFLSKIRRPAQRSIALKIDAAPADRLREVIREIYFDPQTPRDVRDEIATWAQFLPADLVSKTDVSDWDHEINAKLTARERETAAYRRANVQSAAYAEAGDAIGLFALFRATPARDSTGHQNMAKIRLAQGFLGLVLEKKLDTPEVISAMEGIFEEPLFAPKLREVHFWLNSAHKTATKAMIAHVLEGGSADSLLESYDGNPAEQERILRVMKDLPYLDPKRRELLKMLEYRTRSDIAHHLHDLCKAIFKETPPG